MNSLSAWSPDYPDPMTYIDMFVTGSSFNEMDYSNPKYDELVAKSKGELLKDDKARWNALAEAEKILIGQDAAISPTYQQSTAYLEKPYVKVLQIIRLVGTSVINGHILQKNSIIKDE